MTVIRYEANCLPIAEVLKKFISQNDLISALRDGVLVAYGRYSSDPSNDIDGSLMPISREAWYDLKLVGSDLFGGTDEHGSDDPYEYRSIIVEQSSLAAMLEKGKNPRNAGRPPKYKWDEFYGALVIDVNDNGYPATLDAWVDKVQEDDAFKVVWGNGEPPSDSVLKDRLRPIFAVLSADKNPR